VGDLRSALDSIDESAQCIPPSDIEDAINEVEYATSELEAALRLLAAHEAKD